MDKITGVPNGDGSYHVNRIVDMIDKDGKVYRCQIDYPRVDKQGVVLENETDNLWTLKIIDT